MKQRLSPVSPHVTPQTDTVNRADRWEALGLNGATVWLTGIPAAGKSTIAAAVQQRLITQGRPAYVLDGDSLRHGLNGDLGFCAADRAENVRRTAHVAALMADAGFVALVALVSPYRVDRDTARTLHEATSLPYMEVFVDTPLPECSRRDPKHLYARAARGELHGLTGFDDPYEIPSAPELILRTTEEPLQVLVEQVLTALYKFTRSVKRVPGTGLTGGVTRSCNVG